MKHKNKKKRSKVQQRIKKGVLLLFVLACLGLLFRMGILSGVLLGILWVLLGILVVVLLVVCLILFVPIRYRVQAAMTEGQDIHAKASWLLHLVTVVVEMKEGAVCWKLRVLGIGLAPSAHSEKKTRPKKKQEKPKKTEEPQKTETDAEGTKDDASEQPSKIQSVLATIRKYWTLVRENAEALKKVTAALVQCVVRLFPKRCDLWLRFGMDDPATTGEIYGAYWSVYPMLMASHRNKKKLRVEADFQQKIFRMQGWADGHCSLLHLLWPLLRLIADADIRALIANLKK